jgi:P27 family predicted phage terminase small subunit
MGLTAKELEIWDFVISKAPKGLLKSLDFSTLKIWVRAYVYHQDASEKVEIMGQIVKAPSGFPVLNPYMANVNKQAQIMLKASAEMGFTPASRSRITVEDQSDSDNPFAMFSVE